MRKQKEARLMSVYILSTKIQALENNVGLNSAIDTF